MIFLRKYETELIFPNLFQLEEVILRNLPSVTPPYWTLNSQNDLKVLNSMTPPP